MGYQIYLYDDEGKQRGKGASALVVIGLRIFIGPFLWCLEMSNEYGDRDTKPPIVFTPPCWNEQQKQDQGRFVLRGVEIVKMNKKMGNGTIVWSDE
ncbi:hypothetical protein AAE478_008165 [Parahypoxylon ruwenzoriense]